MAAINKHSIASRQIAAKQDDEWNQGGQASCSSFASFTSRLVPSLSAPSRMKVSASSNEEIPPAALMRTCPPMCCANNLTSSKVAPAVENPVEVLIFCKQTGLDDNLQDVAAADFLQNPDFILDV